MRLLKYLIGGLLLLPLLVALLWWWLLYTEPGASFLFSRATSILDGGLSASGLEGGVATGLSATELEITAGDTTVTVLRPELRADVDLFPVAITLSGVKAAEVRVSVAEQNDDVEPFDIESLLGKLRLPLRLVVTDASTPGILVIRSGEEILRIDNVAFAGSWDQVINLESATVSFGGTSLAGSASVDLVPPQPLSGSVDVLIDGSVTGELESLSAAVTLDGFPEDWQAVARGVAETTRGGRLNFEGRGAGDLRHVVLDEVEINGDLLRSAGAGSVTWWENLAVTAELDVEYANLQALIDNWPEAQPVHGHVAFAFGDRRFRIEPSSLSVTGTGMQLNADGEIDLEAGVIRSQLHWKDLQWPLDTSDPRVASPDGNVELAGDLDDWRVNGELSVVSAGIEDGRFAIDGGGNRDGAEVRIVEGNVLGGRVAGSVAANWTGRHAWHVDLDLQDVRPGVIWPDYAGTVSGGIVAQGQGKPLAFDARLDNVRGEIRNYRLSADGSLSYSEQVLAARNLSIRHGETRLTLDGDVHANGLKFSVSTKRLVDYLPGITGDLSANGNLRIDDGIETLRASIASDRISVDSQEFTDNTIELDSHGLEQTIDLESRYREVSITAGLAGRLAALERPYGWQGQVRELQLRVDDSDSLALVSPANLSASLEKVQVDALCLAGPRDGSVCGSVDWQSALALALDGTVENVPLDHLNRFFDTGFLFDQRISGEATWKIPAGGEAQGRVDVQLSPGVVRTTAEEGLTVQTGPGRAAFDIDADRDINGRLELPLPGTGTLNGNFSLAGYRNPATSSLDGNVRIDVSDLAFVRILLPAIDEAEGELHANVTLGGSLERPYATGEIVLGDGALNYRPLGLQLDDINVTTTFDADRYFELDGSFRAGDGQARLSSRGDYAGLKDTGFYVQIDGSDLELINVPDVQATANTDLSLGFRDGRLTINGNVVVPRARLSARSLPATRRTESGDVVIVSGELPGETEEEDDSPLKISGELGVTLGNDVLVELDVAEASISGSTRFTWNDEIVPMANGRFEIAGQVQAYGQVLDITEGAIRFPKVPADNPKLRIRAEREIFGNSQIKRAGVLVDGTAKRPTVEVYTDPRTTEERALTLLVTGSDFDMEQGVGAIDFGTYIAPKLFVSYGVGLFDRENVISARYDLGKGFGIKATSGQKESGVDLIYRIEK